MRVVFHPAVEPDWLSAIRARGLDVELVNAATPAEALAAMPQAETFCGTLTPALLAAAPRLRWVQATCIGMEHYLFPALVASDVTLTNTRGTYSDVLADQAMAYVLCWARSIPYYLRRQAERRWDPTAPAISLGGKTLGLIGLGGIGQETARRAAVCGLRVIAVDPRTPAPTEGVAELWRPDRLNELLPMCDVVITCVPHTPESVHLFGAEQFARMQRSAFFVNVGRGVVVDLAALTAALRAGAIAGAGLDVFEPEPLPADHPLWAMENVIITPHTASNGADVSPRNLEIFLDNLTRYVQGQPLRNVVDKARWY